ncbi:MAG: hypothetical protein ACK4EX_05015 [Thermaurantimonas sp.]|uniref:hypothetical protein n=1 Tax=Thermaurantimonas sp. TaxID=2681568 RepID=UPI003918AAF2
MMPALIGAFKLSSYFLELERYKIQCKNRDNTEIICNGLCKLSEELSLESQDNEPSKPLLPPIENIIPLFYCTENDSLLPEVPLLFIKKTNHYHYKAFLPQNVISKLEKPPTVG